MCLVMCFFPSERGVCGDTAGECGVNLLTQPLAFRSLRASVWKGKKKRVRLQAADSISCCEQNLQSRQEKTPHIQDRPGVFLMDIITVLSK